MLARYFSMSIKTKLLHILSVLLFRKEKFEYTKGVIRNPNIEEDGQNNDEKEKFEYTKGVIRNHVLKKDGQNNGEKEKDIKTNHDLQNTTHKNKDGATNKQNHSGELRNSV